MKTPFASLLGSTVLACVAIVLWRRSRKLDRLGLLALITVGASTVLTQHALAAERAQAALIPIKSSPNLGWLYLALHLGLVLWVGLGDWLPFCFQIPTVWPALFLFSSYLYLGTLTVAEQGAPYVMLYALIGVAALLGLGRLPGEGGRVPPGRRGRVSLIAFLVLLGLSTAFSRSPGESLNRYLPVVGFSVLPFLLARDVAQRQARAWRLTAGWAVVLGGVLWVALAACKFLLVALELGPVPALRHRLFVDEVGPNWVARPLVILLPLAAGLLLAAPRRRDKLLWGAAVAGMLLALAYSQSDEGAGGWLALALGAGSLGLLLGGPALARWWAGHKRARGPALAVALAVLALLAGAGVWLSASLNAYSFNGRLYVWRIALHQVVDRPLVGSGLGVRYTATRYGTDTSWEEMGPRTQWFDDRPLSRWWQKRQTRVHAHNLLLEWAVGGGVPALLAFLWFLWELARASRSALSHVEGRARALVCGCVAGLVSALGWGMLDVLEFSPPFFSFPAWVLIGLLWAAPRALGGQEAAVDGKEVGLPVRRWPVAALLGVFAVLAGVSLMGNAHYREAYAAHQERRWEAAVDELERASRWEPLNAKYAQMRGEALINLGRYAEAADAYASAARLKRDYAPDYAQLGWLYWLQGDLARATACLERAVELDPREAWRDGLHAELGLAYAASGRVEEAVRLFQASLEVDPESARAPYWVPLERPDGTLDVVLDAAYLPGESGAEIRETLRRRILGHLGQADYTARRFAPDPPAEGALSLHRVLDAVEAHHTSAREAEPRLAPRLLATVAEAARLAGLDERAERAYRAFQEAYPGSAYGYRDLGVLHRDQGRLEQASVQLVRAVQVSPRNVEAWTELAETALDRGLVVEAGRALDTLDRLDALSPRLYLLRARWYEALDEPAWAARALRGSLLVQESVGQRIRLAQSYRSQGQGGPAYGQCAEAARLLLGAWPGPLDPELWEVGVCLAETSPGYAAIEMNAWDEAYPLIGNVLLGHVYRAGGRLEQAHGRYAEAARADPGLGGPHYLLGETYDALGQAELAERHYQEAVRLDAFESLAFLALGRLQAERGQYETALASLRAAVEATPGWSQAHLALGNALLRAGDRAGAADHYGAARLLERGLGEGWTYDLAAHLAEAEISSPGPGYVQSDLMTVGGEVRRVLFAHPAGGAGPRIHYRVAVPADAVLAFEVATAPGSWTQAGDGVVFAVHLSTVGDAAQEQAPDESAAWRLYLDPKHDPGARRWHSYRLDLGGYAGQVVDLTLETGPGPAGDARYDWAVWGEPRLVIRPAVQAGTPDR